LFDRDGQSSLVLCACSRLSPWTYSAMFVQVPAEHVMLFKINMINFLYAECANPSLSMKRA